MKDVIFNDEDFKKSSLSRGPGGMAPGRCVAVAQKNGLIAVRDTKDASKATLYFDNEEWAAFIGGVKNGEFDC